MTTTSVFDQMPLEQLEEASGELHRRAAAALRRIGDARADEADAEGLTPRQRIASLIAAIEQAASTLGAAASGIDTGSGRVDPDPAYVAAIMYGAPTIAGLLGRLEQNRRMLTSLARQLEPPSSEPVATPSGAQSIRQLVIEHAISEPARGALALEHHSATLEARELAASEEP